MTEQLISRFEKRINHENFKREFLKMLNSPDRYKGFDEQNKSFNYVIGMETQMISKIVNMPINVNKAIHRFFISFKNGELKVNRVA